MLELAGQALTLDQIAEVASGAKVALAPGAIDKVLASRKVIEQILEHGAAVYGVTTGFGKLSDVRIPPAETAQLQVNLVRSHACGVGPLLSREETRATILLRANVLALGFSGVRLEVIESLIAMLDADVLPAIPSKGSVGASGDLAPLAQLALGVIGEGRTIEGPPMAEAMAEAGLKPLDLQAKEGLALLNGTQVMSAVGALALRRAFYLCELADVAGAMTLEALLGTPDAFDARIHFARPHQGQRETASHLCELLDCSEVRESHRDGDPRVQDAYSLRCMPQVHGAARDALRYAAGVVQVESGSATDNPLVFADTCAVISGGNFHGAPVALALDLAKIAVTDLASISERRIDRLVNPDSNEGLPPFLTTSPGTSSGFMIPHVVAAALLNECKTLAHPASVDSLPTSGGKEDHVSMGMTAALHLRQVVENAEQVIAIELIAAAQGLDYRRPLRAGHGVERAYEAVRAQVPKLDKDRSLSDDFERLATLIAERKIGPF